MTRTGLIVAPYKKLCILSVILFAVFLCPVDAGTQYLYGNPNLSVSIAGTNEITPGSDTSILITVMNTGSNEYKYVNPTVASRDELPDTAKDLVVQLFSGDAPLAVKSDSRMTGDLGSGGTTVASFPVKVASDAPSGTYHLLVMLNYSYLKTTEQFGSDTISYTYSASNVTVPVPVVIRPRVNVDVVSAIPEDLNIGTEGYLTISIRNSGSENGRNAVVRVLRSAKSPIIPIDSGVYIGDFPVGATATCRYKVSVAPDAGQSLYPVDILVVYENSEGDTETSPTVTAGIPVSEKIEFAITSDPVEIHPGEKREVTVAYKNTGNTTIRGAKGRIMVVAPFTSNDDIAYLGDIGPGESVTASYTVDVDNDATIKKYGLDSEIRYQDAGNTTYVSNTMKVEIDVTRRQGLSEILSDPVATGIIVVVLALAVLVVFRIRKKRA